jgi:hypothetical protein
MNIALKDKAAIKGDRAPEVASSDYDHPEQNVADLERPPELSAVKARQGIELHEMRYVLLFGTGLTILSLAVTYFFFFFA